MPPHVRRARLATALSCAFSSQADVISAGVLAVHGPATVSDLLCDPPRLEDVATNVLQRLRAQQDVLFLTVAMLLARRCLERADV